MSSSPLQMIRVLLIGYGVVANPVNVTDNDDDSKDEHNNNGNAKSPKSDTNSDSEAEQSESKSFPQQNESDDVYGQKMYPLSESLDSLKSCVTTQSTWDYDAPGLPTSGYTCRSRSSGALTLSTDDLTLDAAMVRPPQRSGSGQNQKPVYSSDFVSRREPEDHLQELKKAQPDSTKGKRTVDDAEMEELIKRLVAATNKTKVEETIKLFDAAVIYDKSDYEEVRNFIDEVKVIVKQDLEEELRIECYDSEVFSQSQIVVVEDLIKKCSLVLAYLTSNCKSETFKFLCEEGIGISRLGLNNPDVMAQRIRNEKQFIMKPVHTKQPSERYYHTPIGLVTVNGIDWYDKWSAHTRSKIVSTMKSAIISRKSREIEENTAERYRQALAGGFPQRPAKPDCKLPHPGYTDLPSVSSTVAQDALSMEMSNMSLGHAANQGMMYKPAPTQRPSFMPQGPHSFNYQHPCMPVYQQPNINHSMMPGQMLYHNGMMPAQVMHGAQVMQTDPMSGYSAQIQGLPNTGYMPSMVNDHSFNQLQSSFPPREPYYNSGQMMQYQSLGQPVVPMDAYGQPINSNVNHYSSPLQQGQLHVGQSQQGQALSGPAQLWPPPSIGPPQGQQLMGRPPSARSPSHNSAGLNQQQRQAEPQNLSKPAPHSQQQQQYGHQQRQQLQQQQQPHEQQSHSRASNDRYSSSASGTSLFANDAPPSSELRVVSKVTGKLIVHPNLSTDDVEVDTEGNETTKQNVTDQHHSQNGSLDKKGDRMVSRSHSSRRYHSDSSESNDDSDTDSDDDDLGTLKSGLGKSKNRSVNIVGCKYVQLGRKNKIQEQKRVVPQPTSAHERIRDKDVVSDSMPGIHNIASIHRPVSVEKPELASKMISANFGVKTSESDSSLITCDKQKTTEQTHSVAVDCYNKNNNSTQRPTQSSQLTQNLSNNPSENRSEPQNNCSKVTNVNVVSVTSYLSGISEDYFSPMESLTDNQLYGSGDDNVTTSSGGKVVPSSRTSSELYSTTLTSEPISSTNARIQPFTRSITHWHTGFLPGVPLQTPSHDEDKSSDGEVD